MLSPEDDTAALIGALRDLTTSLAAVVHLLVEKKVFTDEEFLATKARIEPLFNSMMSQSLKKKLEADGSLEEMRESLKDLTPEQLATLTPAEQEVLKVIDAATKPSDG